MLLEHVASGAADLELERGEIAADRSLAADVQAVLVLDALLDPPVDRSFGPVSAWALDQFAKEHAPGADGVLTRALARALIERRDRGAHRFELGAGGFASRVVAAMQRRGYWLSRHPDCLTIAYLEGCGPDGTLNRDAPNEFNDCRLLIRAADGGGPQIVGAWEATTEPGRHWTENPMDRAGAARIAFGQMKAWSVGEHHAGRPAAHEALVQVAEVTVFRDLNRDYEREGDKRFTGLFCINQHWGYDRPRADLGRSSAGCLVGRSKDGHRDFMRLIKSDPRYRVNRSYRFMTAVMPGTAAEEAGFDPSDPH